MPSNASKGSYIICISDYFMIHSDVQPSIFTNCCSYHLFQVLSWTVSAWTVSPCRKPFRTLKGSDTSPCIQYLTFRIISTRLRPSHYFSGNSQFTHDLSGTVSINRVMLIWNPRIRYACPELLLNVFRASVLWWRYGLA